MIPLSSRATGLSLILRSASLTWDGRRQKLVNSHFVATSCQMTKDSSLLKHWILLVSVATNTWEQMMWQGWFPYPSEAHPCHGTQINRMLSCARAVRLQTGMCGTFRKPQGTVTRVHTGQATITCTKLQNEERVMKAQVPWLPEDHISKKWGFPRFNTDEFEDMVMEKWLIPEGCGVKYTPNHGPLNKWRALHSSGLPRCSRIH